MIDEKEILAARNQIAGLASRPIIELLIGDWVLVPWGLRVFVCQVTQINMARDKFGPHWSVTARVDDGKTKGSWNFFLPTDYRVIVIRGVA